MERLVGLVPAEPLRDGSLLPAIRHEKKLRERTVATPMTFCF
jgi:hypothetical protein